MPKLIDYPRTSYSGAWELAEVTDDTGGKCAIDTAARKLNRKVSGSFKAIIGSAVKFGLITSKRDLLTTTTLFKRIKHAYDKQEEIIFHREAFLTPPLFTQICRKFRSRELPVQMLDVMLIREFGVEEINAQGVSKAFVEGARMVGLLDENNIIADIDALSAKNIPRREVASPQPVVNTFRTDKIASSDTLIGLIPFTNPLQTVTIEEKQKPIHTSLHTNNITPLITLGIQPENNQIVDASTENNDSDAIASLFGLLPMPMPQKPATESTEHHSAESFKAAETAQDTLTIPTSAVNYQAQPISTPPSAMKAAVRGYQIQINGQGVNTSLSITEEADIDLAVALLEKIRRQLKA